MAQDAETTEGKDRLTRRRFLKTVGATAAVWKGSTLPVVAAEGEAEGTNDPIGIGFIGCGGRWGAHIGVVQALKKAGEKVEPVAVCDVYGPRLKAAAKRTGGKPYKDHHDLLADPNVDAVCIATPDRLHAIQAIDAVRAGKDVYCEKPMTHWSQTALAKQLAEEVKKHKRILQVGVQRMADSVWEQAAELVKKGAIGKPIHVQSGYFRRGDWGERMHIPDPNAKPGPDLDWEAFLADAPKRPFTVSRFFQWRMYWDYSGGPSTDLFPHTFTPLFRVLGVTFPKMVAASGGKFHYDGVREVPDTFNMFIDYPEGVSVALLCTLANASGMSTVIRGTEGTITFGGKGIIVHPPHGSKKPKEEIARKHGGDTRELWQNLLKCIRTREKPFSDVEMGYHVQTALNMGILALREGQVARFDPEKEEILI